MDADDYNEQELDAGRLKPAHVSELVARFQMEHNLPVDGKAGPTTRAVIELLRGRAPEPRPTPTVPVMQRAPELRIADGWIVAAPGVEAIPSHPSWYYAPLTKVRGIPVDVPRAIVAHYTATAHGTARAMARNRAKPFRDGTDRPASWHLSIEGDGTIVQMAPLTAGCWHAGGKTSLPVPGLGVGANYCSVGIELVGDGSVFPDEQVAAACRVWRAIVLTYGVIREHAMVQHSELDPTRKRDPGRLWMTKYAPIVLACAYQ